MTFSFSNLDLYVSKKNQCRIVLGFVNVVISTSAIMSLFLVCNLWSNDTAFAWVNVLGMVLCAVMIYFPIEEIRKEYNKPVPSLLSAVKRRYINVKGFWEHAFFSLNFCAFFFLHFFSFFFDGLRFYTLCIDATLLTFCSVVFSHVFGRMLSKSNTVVDPESQNRSVVKYDEWPNLWEVEEPKK